MEESRKRPPLNPDYTTILVSRDVQQRLMRLVERRFMAENHVPEPLDPKLILRKDYNREIAELLDKAGA